MLEVLEPDGYAEHLNCLDCGDHRGWEWLSSLGCQQGYHGETRVAPLGLGPHRSPYPRLRSLDSRRCNLQVNFPFLSLSSYHISRITTIPQYQINIILVYWYNIILVESLTFSSIYNFNFAFFIITVLQSLSLSSRFKRDV